MQKLSQKTAIITGAAQGIGKAIAEAFVKEGAHVLLTDQDVPLGKSTAAGLGMPFAELDVCSETHWSRLADTISSLDILVNNAGITGLGTGQMAHDPEHTSLEEWRNVHATNAEGTFLGCRMAISLMRRQGKGSIINMASRSGLGIPGAVAYAASKAAIINHTRSVALYCAQQGLTIRCNAIAPAAIMTPIWKTMLGDGPDYERRIAQLIDDTPLKRFGLPEEVSALAVMLASDEVTYMTGEILTIDGGLLAGSAASPG